MGLLCFVMFLPLCLVSLIWRFDHLNREEDAGCFDFRWFVTCAQSVIACLLFLLTSLVSYVLCL